MAKSFHCDNCGEAVSPDEERCPGCGRFFRAVKCPVCGYTGKGAEFLRGCPVCGYLADSYDKTPQDKKKKKDSFLSMSRMFAYSAIFFLSAVLVYLIYLFTKI
ncbi:rubredoxin-like domain-containing protein [Spirochaeta isovalerica]|uniref:SsDNA-binding Zn-finger/Zn-ribbon topoisomerase 1 n=1 Tax=Spirochaeta isovalerica TaxID=150 RepID=A0A841R5N3_9SPIO|nr:hypothetical protein [Spirochaeta isovalerica]MBB6479165.1 ssDNA-binding Zn-finger/Zn-ribbon topoisomerase 1 [Spirochaeta isovalerica]